MKIKLLITLSLLCFALSACMIRYSDDEKPNTKGRVVGNYVTTEPEDREQRIKQDEEILRRQKQDLDAQQRELDDLQRQDLYNRSLKRYDKY